MGVLATAAGAPAAMDWQAASAQRPAMMTRVGMFTAVSIRFFMNLESFPSFSEYIIQASPMAMFFSVRRGQSP
jgi:hypothetical protein